MKFKLIQSNYILSFYPLTNLKLQLPLHKCFPSFQPIMLTNMIKENQNVDKFIFSLTSFRSREAYEILVLNLLSLAALSLLGLCSVWPIITGWRYSSVFFWTVRLSCYLLYDENIAIFCMMNKSRSLGSEVSFLSILKTTL